MRRHKQVLGGLVAVAVVAAGAAWYCVSREAATTRAETAAATQLDTLVERAARFDGALRAFGTLRMADALWYTQTAGLLEEVHAQADVLDSTLTGVAMMPRARLAEALQGAAEAVDRSRANFDSGRALMALDVLESAGRPAADAMLTALGTIRKATREELTATRDIWRLRAWGALALWVVAWSIGLVWLVRRNAQLAGTASVDPGAGADNAVAVAPPLAPPPLTVGGRDLSVVAEVCEAIAHVESAEELPRALARTTHAIGATGVALWARDGDALVVLASHGYPEGLAQRLGRVALQDENLLTGAWHGRQPLTASAPAGQKAALVSPILGVTGTIGVLAAEVPSGMEGDPQVVVSARLIAAQLSTVLSEARPKAEAMPNAQCPMPNEESEGAPATPAGLPLEAAG
jgi:hypothetical protein